MAERTSFSSALKRYRVAAGFSQEALAARAGLSARAISDLERGLHRAPHASTIDLLAAALTLSAQQRAVLLAAAHPNLEEPPFVFESHAPHAHSLPVAPTRLIGREPERSQARATLGATHSRLLTLSGPSGVGKTRLALQIAADLAGDFSDGAVFVELAPIREATLLGERILQALGLREQPQTSAVDLAQAYLRDKRLLLVLDNFEHVREASPMVAQLLAHCPHIAILITSRVSLRLRGEQLLPLAPLPLDAAVALFRERARAVRPDRELAPADVEAICEHIDRLPLAIELAAAESLVFSMRSLREQLMRRLAVLRRGAADAPTRQQTMEAAIAWSYELLSETQRRCFRALGVFTDGWTLEAAQAVCWPAGDAAAPDTLVTLAALVDASMASAEETADGSVRFHLLELLREYALARLADAGEEQDCRARHARYFADMADAVTHFGPEPHLHGADPSAELGNARAALEWAQHEGEAAVGLRLVGFSRVWYVGGQMREAIAWQERMLALDEQTRARDEARAAPLALRAQHLYGFARTLLGAGEYERAEASVDESLTLAQHIHDNDLMCNAYATQGMVAQARGQYDMAASAFAAASAYTRPNDQTGLRSRILALLAQSEHQQGNTAIATAHLKEALTAARTLGNTWDTASIAAMLGALVRQQRHSAQATRYYMEALTLFRRFSSPNFSAWCLEGYAAVLADEERQAESTRLCAAAATLREQARTPAPPAERVAVEALLADARARLGEAAFAEAWHAGAALSRDAAIAEALAFGASRLSAEASPDDVTAPDE